MLLKYVIYLAVFGFLQQNFRTNYQSVIVGPEKELILKNTTKNRAERQSSVDERHAKFEGFLIERKQVVEPFGQCFAQSGNYAFELNNRANLN